MCIRDRTDRHRHRNTETQTERHRQTDRQTNIQADKRTDGETGAAQMDTDSQPKEMRRSKNWSHVPS